jgi:hypothetical protein
MKMMSLAVRGKAKRSAAAIEPKHGLLGNIAFSWLAIVAVACLLSPFGAWAQVAGTGEITGTVSDQTGRVIAGAQVNVTNTATNVSTVRYTTSAGSFTANTLIPGTYTVKVSAKGFESFVRESLIVDALSQTDVPVTLTVGQASVTVTVSTESPVMKTSDSTIGSVMENVEYSNLPIQMNALGQPDQRRATDFSYLAPGMMATNAGGAEMNLTSATPIYNGSGTAGGTGDMYIDGLDLPLALGNGDPRATWTAIGVDAIDQFQIETDGISAQYQGQGMQNYSIKSGGNAIHAAVYEYFRNTDLDAWQFTDRVPKYNSSGTILPNGYKTRENQNETGLILSGPILKNKLFYFGNYGQYREAKGALYTPYTMPNAVQIGYDPTSLAPLGYADYSGYATSNGAAHIYDPATQTPNCAGTSSSPCSRTQFAYNGTADRIPASRFSPASNYYNQFLLPYEKLMTAQGFQGNGNPTVYSNNLFFGAPTGLSNWYWTNRFDYTQSTRNQISAIVAFGRQSNQGYGNLQPPFNTGQLYHPDTNDTIIKDTFTVTPHIVNQVAVAFARYESDSVTGDRTKQFAANSAGILNMPIGQAFDGFPQIKWSGNYNAPGTLGGYSWNDKINNTYNVTDNVVWEFGRHNITVGLQWIHQEYNYYSVLGGSGPMSFTFSNGQTAQFSASGSGTVSTNGSPVASYLLGAVNASSGSVGIPGLGTRWIDPGFWATDNYKITNKITLNYGLRWDILPAVRESHNIFTFLNPTGSNSITGNLGTLGFAGYGINGMYCNCNSPSPTYMKNLQPRVGLAYAVRPDLVVHANYSVNFARGNQLGGSQNGSPSQTGITPSATAPGGLSSAPAFYWDNGPCSAGNADTVACGWTGSVAIPAPPAGGTSLAEYGTTNTSVLTNAGGFTLTYWDPQRGARAQEFDNWSIGVQAQLTKSMSVSADYVANEGHFLSGKYTSANNNDLGLGYAAMAGYAVIGGAAVPCSAANCGQSGYTTLLGSKATAANIALAEGVGFTPPNPYSPAATYYASNGLSSYFTRFPQFSGVSDATAYDANTDYNALQVQVKQRTAYGLDFMFNYTWSKTMDDEGTYREYDNPKLDRSLSTINMPTNITASTVYQLPFGKGQLGGSDRLVRYVAGGWQASGIFYYHSGTPITFTGSSGCGGSGILNQCMPSLVPGVPIRTNSSYQTNPTGITAANYSQFRYFNGAAFVINENVPVTSTTPVGSTTPITSGGVTVGEQYNAGAGPGLYVPGTAYRAGAGGIYGPNQYNFDFGLSRDFKVWEKLTLKFRADLLNATNHVNWIAPSGSVGGGSFGQYSTTSTSAVANQSRDAQLSARIEW